MHISVFRKHKKNAGDWHSVPASFLPLKGQETFDLAAPETIPNEPGTIVLGGGGLGRPDFEPFLNALMRPDRKYQVIAWGVGADSVTKKKEILSEPTDMERLSSYFEDMDDVGTRIDFADSPLKNNFCWVPCASCLSPLFDSLRDIPTKRKIGVYEHLRESVVQHLPRKSRITNRLFEGIGFGSNRGSDLEEKLRFLAESEYVFTNSYHGVYWATLLDRKVVCFPFKNGLFSFRHRPAYFHGQSVQDALDAARTYPDALDECRQANLEFYDRMKQKYGDF